MFSEAIAERLEFLLEQLDPIEGGLEQAGLTLFPRVMGSVVVMVGRERRSGAFAKAKEPLSRLAMKLETPIAMTLGQPISGVVVIVGPAAAAASVVATMQGRNVA